MGLLDGELAALIGDVASEFFLDATLTRDVAAIGSPDVAYDPVMPTQVTYACKAIEEQYGAGLRRDGLVAGNEIEILILASTLATEPRSLDRLTIRGKTVTVVPPDVGGLTAVRSDPARATWLCRCST